MLNYLTNHGTQYMPPEKYKHRVKPEDTPQGWTRFRRQSHRVKGKLLRFLETFVSGNYAVGPKFIIFEKEQDAVIYRLKYPR